jgi:plastocyanin domain-containing protein
VKRIAALLIVMALSVFSLAYAKGEEKVFRATTDPDGVQRVEVRGGSYYYNPNRIIVKVNVPVELKLKKDGKMVPHNIVMKAPEAGIEFDTAMSGDPKTVTFTPKKTGIFPFHCSKKLPFIASHKDKGMEGVLEVVQ